MRILYLAHRIPYPPDKGDKIRAYHQIRHLAQRHSIDLCTLVDEPADRAHVGELERLCRRVEAVTLPAWRARARAGVAVATGRPFSTAFFREPELVRRVDELLRRERYDAVVMFCSAMGGVLPRDWSRLGIPLIADYCDLDSAKWAALARRGAPLRRLLFGTEARRLARHEVRLARASRVVGFATPLEAEDFAALDGAPGAADVRVIANGVDLERFARGAATPARQPTVVFTGAMDYLPNHEGALWLVDRVWPRVREALPEARLRIVGRNPRAELVDRRRVPGVDVTGTVPDIRPYLHEAWVAVAPLHVARGVQNKVLEAMAAGVPTVISPAVSRGLEARTGVETLVSDNETGWATTLVRLLRAPRLRSGLAAAALDYVRVHHDWHVHGAAWEQALRDATEASATRLEALA